MEFWFITSSFKWPRVKGISLRTLLLRSSFCVLEGISGILSNFSLTLITALMADLLKID